MKLSWYPLASTYEGSGEDQGRWTPHAEQLYKKRKVSLLDGNVKNNLSVPVGASKWRDKLRGMADARRAKKQMEMWSAKFLEDNLVRQRY